MGELKTQSQYCGEKTEIQLLLNLRTKRGESVVKHSAVKQTPIVLTIVCYDNEGCHFFIS